MKKYLWIFTLLLSSLGMACNNKSNADTADDPSSKLTTEESRALLHSMGKTNIPYEQVESYANLAIDMLGKGTRSSSRSIAGLTPIIEQKTIQTRSGSSVVSDTTMYIANFADKKGYAIISTDILTSNIVAIVENGSIASLEEIAEKPNPMLCYSLMAHLTEKSEMQDKKDSLAESAKAKIAAKGDYSNDVSTRYADGDVIYGPWYAKKGGYCIKTIWGDGPKYNDNCPMLSCGHRALAGHSAAAIMQIAQHHQKMGPYPWHESMWTYPDSRVPPEVVVNIKKLYFNIANRTVLTWSCGNVGCVNYNNGYSQGTLQQSIDALQYLGFTTTTHSVSVTPSEGEIVKLKSDVRNGYPVFMNGKTGRSITSGPQGLYFSWIVDGYGDECREMTVFYNGTSITTTDSYDRLLHCNMGFEGTSNGYYKIDKIILNNTSEAYHDFPWFGTVAGFYPEDVKYLSIRK